MNMEDENYENVWVNAVIIKYKNIECKIYLEMCNEDQPFFAYWLLTAIQEELKRM